MLEAMRAQRIVPVHDPATERGIGGTLDEIKAYFPKSTILRKRWRRRSSRDSSWRRYLENHNDEAR